MKFIYLCAGHGDSNGKNVPTLVKDINQVGQVACGSSHTIVVSLDGRIVWSFGAGDNGTDTKMIAFHEIFLWNLKSTFTFSEREEIL